MAEFNDSWRSGGTGLGEYILTPKTTAGVPLILQGLTSQVANLFEIKNAAGTTLFSVDNNGDVTYVGDEVIADALTVGGIATFNGALIANSTATFNGNVVLGNSITDKVLVYSVFESQVAEVPNNSAFVIDTSTTYADANANLFEIKNHGGRRFRVASNGDIRSEGDLYVQDIISAGDLYLPSGGKIDWASGDVTITHSTNTLSFAGATSGYNFDNLSTFTKNSLGTTTQSMVSLVNGTAATVGAQQVSPSMLWSGNGWKTDATAGSQNVRWQSYLLPVQDAANPSANLIFQSSINAGAFADKVIMTSGGKLQLPTGGIVETDTIRSYNSSSLSVFGQEATDGSAVAVKIGNTTALTTTGDKIASFYSDGGSTEKAYVNYLGAWYSSSARALGTTTAPGVFMANTTAAAAGVQQVSPSLVMRGNGWKTDATAASQTCDIKQYVLPVQGAAAPIATWILAASINGGADANLITANTGGINLNYLIYLNENTVEANSRKLYFGANLTTALEFDTGQATSNTLMVWLSTTSKSIIFSDMANEAKDHDHTAQANPTIFIHSVTNPDSDNTQWGSLAFIASSDVFKLASGSGATHIAGTLNLGEESSVTTNVFTVVDQTARTADLASFTAGSVATPVATASTQTISASMYNASTLGSVFSGNFYSGGLTGVPAVGGGFDLGITTHASDPAGSFLYGYAASLDASAGGSALPAAFLDLSVAKGGTPFATTLTVLNGDVTIKPTTVNLGGGDTAGDDLVMAGSAATGGDNNGGDVKIDGGALAGGGANGRLFIGSVTATNVGIGTSDLDGTPAIGRLTVKGSTNDGSTNIFVGRDSDEANVYSIDTNGKVTANGGFTDGTFTVASGAFTGVASITDGTATWTGGATNTLAGFASISGTTLTDGTASLSSGVLSSLSTLNGITIAGGTNTFSLTNGSASLDVAAGATVNIDTSLTVNTEAVTLDQSLSTTDDVQFQTLTTTGGRIKNTTTVNAATYDLLATDDILHVTYTGIGAVTSLTLPSAQVVDGRTIVIKDAGGNASANNITIDTEGAETIDGSATYVINSDYGWVKLYSDGSNWFIIS